MSRVLTACWAALLTMMASGAQADPGYRTFAACTGRLSAEVASAWLLQSPHADAAEALRDHLADITEALTPDDAAADAMSHRLHAKVAHGDLLRMAAFAADRRDREWARDRATDLSRRCAALVLVPDGPFAAGFADNSLPAEQAPSADLHNDWTISRVPQPFAPHWGRR